MRPRDTNRQRRLVEYKPLESTREERAMKYHEQVQKQWEATGKRLAKITGRDPTTLSMFSEDDFRRMNEERFLISQVVSSLVTKDQGAWSPLPRIGDLYAQRERPNFERFEVIRNPDEHHQNQDVPGQRPSNWFKSKYYRKRAKQLRSFIEKIKPFEPDTEGLEIIGHTPDFMQEIQKLPEVQMESTQILDSHHSEEETVNESSCKISFDTNRLFFTTAPGSTQAKNVSVSNEGTCAIYYRWDVARDTELIIGAGSSRTPVKMQSIESKKDNQTKSVPEHVDNFDWRASESFTISRNLQPKTRSEFCFTQISGSILPGNTVTFSFSFKSDIPGCFLQKWIMRTTPNTTNSGANSSNEKQNMSVSLRGCCQVDPPDLTSFKASIDNSLHESERSRCIEEIMSSIFDRVKKISEMNKQAGDERIDGDVLIDDRAPSFELANKKWGLIYSPGLFSSLLQIAEKCWDELNIQGFERFWDYSVDSLNEMIMKIEDGSTKRNLILQLNNVIMQKMTSSALGNLSYSLGYLQLAASLDDLPKIADNEASKIGKELPPFIIPKVPDPNELEEAAESSRRRHRGKRDRKPTLPKKTTRKGGKGAEDDLPQQEITHAEIADDLRASIKVKMVKSLIERLRAFERLSGESKGVAQQLTRINEIDKLDTNLDVEVDDDLEE
ncbi:hypothetical protein TRFO_20081 [Tritrichomonas foetus]|uniref:MYCBP-associated protein n=1 Tax=Tritrichomonas foetus TaxID=1144522 RepID=A0A1J4KGQ1_9EUKA|nr:hypothetical protein TRFO_20081 [Tritrichomonas foetus]|eukprot:OHT10583.1 hypothetical protein TRFO_20081 [Tritrichomonas foetus]